VSLGILLSTYSNSSGSSTVSLFEAIQVEYMALQTQHSQLQDAHTLLGQLQATTQKYDLESGYELLFHDNY
jgi:hypothetical protein